MSTVGMWWGLNIEDQVSPGKGHDKIINTITPVWSGATVVGWATLGGPPWVAPEQNILREFLPKKG